MWRITAEVEDVGNSRVGVDSVMDIKITTMHSLDIDPARQSNVVTLRPSFIRQRVLEFVVPAGHKTDVGM